MAIDDRITVLGDALRGLLGEPSGLADLSDDQLCAEVPELAGLFDLFGALVTGRVGEWDSRGLYGLDGSRSASARLARDAGWSKQSAGELVTRAKRLRRHTQVAEAYRNSELSTDKVAVLCKAAIPARRALFDETEAERVL